MAGGPLTLGWSVRCSASWPQHRERYGESIPLKWVALFALQIYLESRFFTLRRLGQDLQVHAVPLVHALN